MCAITGSGDERSTQELVKVTSWLIVSFGPRGVSGWSSAGIKGSGWVCADSERDCVYELRRLRTRVWKWSLVMGLVIMSYFHTLAWLLYISVKLLHPSLAHAGPVLATRPAPASSRGGRCRIGAPVAPCRPSKTWWITVSGCFQGRQGGVCAEIVREPTAG
jgi:hypothetical protein